MKKEIKNRVQLVEALNKLDKKCIDENKKFYDLKTLYEAVEPKLNAQDKAELKNIINSTSDPRMIDAFLELKDDEINESIKFCEEYDDELGQYELYEKKSVMDSDGFMTDYCMYYDALNDRYVFVFGDSDIYSPEDGDFDYECETEDEAYEWFEDYSGFDDDLNESFHYKMTGTEDDNIGNYIENFYRILDDNNNYICTVNEITGEDYSSCIVTDTCKGYENLKNIYKGNNGLDIDSLIDKLSSEINN